MRWPKVLAIFYPVKHEADRIEIYRTEAETERLRQALAEARRRMMAETIERAKSNG